MSKEASKKRREAEARLIADLLAALPAFEMPRRSQHNSSTSSSMNNNNAANVCSSTQNSQQQQGRKSSSGGCYEDTLSNGVSSMALSISATLPTLRYAAVFARKQALLNQAFNMISYSSDFVKQEKIEAQSAEVNSSSFIHRSELPGLIVVFDPAKRLYPISNGTPLEVAGEMVYVSENVMTYLGHSVQDILSRADSVYDLLLPEERPKIMDIVTRMMLEQTGERSFLCRFSNALFTRRVRTMSSDYKLMLVKARLLMSSSPLVVFTCCPVLTPLYQRDIDFLVHEPGVFTFKCSPELIITRVDNRAGQFLAFEDETELLGRRWLNLIHPDDLVAIGEQLRGVLGPNKRDDAATMFVVRMLRAGDEASPTKCIYTSVVLAYRHFGGASLNGNNNNSPNPTQQQPTTPTTPSVNGADKMEDEAFSETCQPSVAITCQVLPDNNMEIVNEIKRYANPLFNCHGLSRTANATTATPTAGINNPTCENSANNTVTNGSSSVNATSSAIGHYRRNNSHTGTQSQNPQPHVRRQAHHRMSFRSSVTSYDGYYDANVDAASVVTAPVSAMLARRIPPSRRSSAISVPGIPPGGRMQASTSDYMLYLAAQQQAQQGAGGGQQQPVVKRQRTSLQTDLIYSGAATDGDQQQQSPMSAVSFGQVATPPSADPWAAYRQHRWEQTSDCSASTGCYQNQQPPPTQSLPVATPQQCGGGYTTSFAETTPVGSPAAAFSTGITRGMRTSQSHMFSKNSAMSSSGSHYQRRSQQMPSSTPSSNKNHRQSAAQQGAPQQTSQLYGTSPSSAHSLSFIDQHYSSNHSNNATGSSTMAKSNSFFFPSMPDDWAPPATRNNRGESLNFQSIAPDVLFSTHNQRAQNQNQNQPLNNHNYHHQGATTIPDDAAERFLCQAALGAPSSAAANNNMPIDFCYHNQSLTAPFASYGNYSSANDMAMIDDQDQWGSSMTPVMVGGGGGGFGQSSGVGAFAAQPGVSVTQQIHERIARKASVKKVTEWLGYNFDSSSAPPPPPPDPGAVMAGSMPGSNGALVASNCQNGATMILPELNNEELSIYLDHEQAVIAEPEPESDASVDRWQQWQQLAARRSKHVQIDDRQGAMEVVCDEDSGFSVGHSADSPMSGASAGAHNNNGASRNISRRQQRQRNTGQSTATSKNPNNQNSNPNNNGSNMVFAM